MADKKQGREIAFVETYEETAKKTIEKAFKVREMKIGHFECKVKYSFYVNRFQREDAKVAIGEEHLDESTIIML